MTTHRPPVKLFNTDTCYFFDDFIGNTYNNRYWYVTTATGSITLLATSILRLTSNTSNTYTFSNNVYCSFLHTDSSCTWRFKILDLTSMYLDIGFANTNSTQYATLRGGATTGVNWYAYTSNGSNSNNIDTGVPTDTAWHELTVKVLPASIVYYLDGNIVATISTYLPTADLKLQASIINADASLTKNVYIDYVEAEGGRLA